MTSPCGHGHLNCATCSWAQGLPMEKAPPPLEVAKPQQTMFGGIRVIVNPYMPAGEQALLLCSQAFYDDLIGKTDPAQRVTEVVEKFKRLGLEWKP